MREKGSIETVNLEDFGEAYKGLRAGIRHLGIGKARAWASRLKAVHQAELERVYLKRKDLEAKGLKDEFPEYWDKDEDGNLAVSTEEGEAAADQVVRIILLDALAYIGDVNEDAPAEDKVEEAFRIGLAHRLMEQTMAVQNPATAEVFSSGS